MTARISSDDEKKVYFNHDVKDHGIGVVSTYDQNGPNEFADNADLRRGLQQRHVQMIALAGAIGTGLFLGSGKAIAHAGPLGAWLGYTLVGVLAVAPVISIAEMAALLPLSGGVVRHAEHFVDPALSFAAGWNTVYHTMVLLPGEIVAAAVLIDFWNDSVSNAVWITILGLALLGSNIILVRVYGEIEFTFAILKIALIIGINIMALVITCGGVDGKTYGFQYWRNPGTFVQYLNIPGAEGRFLGFWTVLGNAVYAYSGVENVASAAAETQSPRRNIPIAAKRVFWRVALFYSLSIFMVGMIVPSTDENLLQSTGTAAQSPFVIAATRAGIKIVPSIINAVVLTSAWSAGNSGLMTGSRVLYGLAMEGRAPKIFKRTSKLGIPWVAILFLCLFCCLGFMSLQDTASTVFSWFQDLVSIAVLINWSIICIVYLRFYYAMQRQNISRSRLPWAGPFQPYAAWVGLFAFVLLMLTGGYTTFIHKHWSTETFVSSYINIPIIILAYFVYKWMKKTTIISLEDVPIMKYIEIADENPEPPAPPVVGWRRLNILWG